MGFTSDACWFLLIKTLVIKHNKKEEVALRNEAGGLKTHLLMTLHQAFTCKSEYLCYRVIFSTNYIEDITRWLENMNFMFDWQEQYLTSERSERVGYCSCHENIKFIVSS